MPDPAVDPAPAPHPLLPSVSTVVSGAAGVPAVIVIAWLVAEVFKIHMPAEVQMALGAVISTAIGYFAKGGRAIDTAE